MISTLINGKNGYTEGEAFLNLENMNTKDEIIKFFKKKEIKSLLVELGVEHLFLVGSFARGENTENSDVDLVYQENKKIRVGGIKFLKNKILIEEKLNRSLDLVDEDSLNKHYKENILKDKEIIF